MSTPLRLFPVRACTQARGAIAPPGARSAQIIALRGASPLRRCVIDAPHDGMAGRMVLSGRIDAVCAALDQLVAST